MKSKRKNSSNVMYTMIILFLLLKKCFETLIRIK